MTLKRLLCLLGHEWRLIEIEYYDAVMSIEHYRCDRCGKCKVEYEVEYL